MGKMAKHIFSLVALCSIWLSLTTTTSAIFYKRYLSVEKRVVCPVHYVTGPNNLCFRFHEDRKNWHQAKAQCEAEGGILANTQSGPVYDFVKKHIEANPNKANIGLLGVFGWDNGWWIGASRSGGGFKWLNGQNVGGHYARNQPDNFGFSKGFLFIPANPGEQCLEQMASNNGWNDYVCSKGLRYICQQNANPCLGFNCGKGRCVAKGMSASCACNKGWTGSRCDAVADPCKGVNCNNGKCVADKKIGGKARCICAAGWAGVRCNAVPNFCARKPCKNGGKCVNTGKPGRPSYRCLCPKITRGNNCEKVCRFEVNKAGFPVVMDAMIVFDGSGSLGQDGFKAEKGFISEIVDELDVAPGKTRLTLMQFSSRPRVELNFGGSLKLSPAELRNMIANVDYMKGVTFTGRALERAYKIFKSEGRDKKKFPKLLLVITDGKSDKPEEIPAALKKLDSLGVQMVVIGIGNDKNLNKDELLRIAGGNVNRRHIVGSVKELNHDLISKMVGNICE